MKKILILILVLMITTTALAWSAAEDADNYNPLYPTVGDAVNDMGAQGIRSVNEDWYIVVVKKEGEFLRVIAEMDEYAKELYKAAFPKAEDEEAQRQLEEYVMNLRVTVVELLTVNPMEQAEIDKMAGKSIGELEAEGFENVGSLAVNPGDVTFCMARGLYEYDFIINEDYDTYMACLDKQTFGNLTVKSGKFARVSAHALDLRYYADGTTDPEKEAWEHDPEMTVILAEIADSAQSEFGIDLEDKIAQWVSRVPQYEEVIRRTAEMWKDMGGWKEPGLPEYIYTGDDPITGTAIYTASLQHGEDFEHLEGMTTIPCPIIHMAENTDDTHAKVYATFWLLNYILKDDVLECVSGAEYPSVYTLEKKEDGYWYVTEMLEAGDGTDYERDIQAFAAGNKELEDRYYAAANLDTEENRAIRTQYIREYAEAYGLNISAYQDFGWDPVPLK